MGEQLLTDALEGLASLLRYRGWVAEEGADLRRDGFIRGTIAGMDGAKFCVCLAEPAAGAAETRWVPPERISELLRERNLVVCNNVRRVRSDAYRVPTQVQTYQWLAARAWDCEVPFEGWSGGVRMLPPCRVVPEAAVPSAEQRRAEPGPLAMTQADLVGLLAEKARLSLAAGEGYAEEDERVALFRRIFGRFREGAYDAEVVSRPGANSYTVASLRRNTSAKLFIGEED